MNTVRLMLVVVALFAAVSWPPGPAHAAGGLDLLASIPNVDEHQINNVACGIAAATMVLDLYAPHTRVGAPRPNIGDLEPYVKLWVRGDMPTGTNPRQLRDGLVAASQDYGSPLSASWQRVDDHTQWLAALRTGLDRGDPVIVYLTDGGLLWNGAWRYAHYIVVSGYSDDGSIIYHDPFDGRRHTISGADFAAIWGASAQHSYRTWSYLDIQPVVRQFGDW